MTENVSVALPELTDAVAVLQRAVELRDSLLDLTCLQPLEDNTPASSLYSWLARTSACNVYQEYIGCLRNYVFPVLSDKSGVTTTECHIPKEILESCNWGTILNTEDADDMAFNGPELLLEYPCSQHEIPLTAHVSDSADLTTRIADIVQYDAPLQPDKRLQELSKCISAYCEAPALSNLVTTLAASCIGNASKCGTSTTIYTTTSTSTTRSSAGVCLISSIEMLQRTLTMNAAGSLHRYPTFCLHVVQRCKLTETSPLQTRKQLSANSPKNAELEIMCQFSITFYWTLEGSEDSSRVVFPLKGQCRLAMAGQDISAPHHSDTLTKWANDTFLSKQKSILLRHTDLDAAVDMDYWTGRALLADIQASREGGELFNSSEANASASHTICSVVLGSTDGMEAISMIKPPHSIGTWRLKQVACSPFHTLGLCDNGLLLSWGSGTDGCLGHGDFTTVPQPRVVEYFGLVHPLSVEYIAAGGGNAGCHSLVVARNTSVTGKQSSMTRIFSWGAGYALGTGSYLNSAVPAEIDAGVSDIYAEAVGGVVQLSAGDGFSVALTKSGALYTWGAYQNGRLGVPAHHILSSNGSSADSPRFVLRPLRVVHGIQASHFHSASARIKKVVFAPNAVGEETLAFRQIACGRSHTLAIDVFGYLWSWGAGQAGQLGLGRQEDCFFPQRVDATAHTGNRVQFKHISCGGNASFAIATDGRAFAWGNSGEGAVSIAEPPERTRFAKTQGWWLRPARMHELEVTTVNDSLITIVAGNGAAFGLTAAGNLIGWAVGAQPKLTLHPSAQCVRGRQLHSSLHNCREPVSGIVMNGSRICVVLGPALLSTSISQLLERMDFSLLQDAVVMCEGAGFPCHSSVLSARSTKLATVLDSSERSYEGRFVLDVTDISAATLLLLLEFMYSDSLQNFPTLGSVGFTDLRRAAKLYGLESLYAMMTMMAESDIAYWLRAEADAPTGVEAEVILPAAASSGFSEAAESFTRSCRSYFQDMSQLVHKPQLGDKLLASGNVALYAHGVVLTQRSEYLRTLWAQYHNQAIVYAQAEHPACFVRMLYFLYFDSLLDYSSCSDVQAMVNKSGMSFQLSKLDGELCLPTDMLRRELIAAEKWGMPDYSAAVQANYDLTNVSIPAIANVCKSGTYEILQRRVVRHIASRLHDLDMSSLVSEMPPGITSAIMQRAFQDNSAVACIMSIQNRIKKPEDQPPAKPQLKAWFSGFPWMMVALLVAVIVFFTMVSKFNLSTSNLVPAVNVLAIIACCYFAYRTL